MGAKIIDFHNNIKDRKIAKFLLIFKDPERRQFVMRVLKHIKVREKKERINFTKGFNAK